MNSVVLVGRMTKDPTITYSTGENATAVARFSVAVSRKFKDADGNYSADFPSVVAFGKSAEFVEKYFHKGSMIGITGRIQTGSYTNKEGVKVYTTDVVAENVEFVGSKADNEGGGNANTSANNSFMDIPEDAGADLPFK